MLFLVLGSLINYTCTTSIYINLKLNNILTTDYNFFKIRKLKDQGYN